MEYRRNKNNNKRKKGLFDRFLEYTKLDDDDLFDEDIDEYYSRNKETQKDKKTPEWFNMPLHYDDELLIDKLIMGELLNLGDIEDLMNRTMREFKRTFSAPNKNIEVVFREFKGKDFGDVIKEVFEDEKSKDGDEDEKEKS